jgi:hypothetical protein
MTCLGGPRLRHLEPLALGRVSPAIKPSSAFTREPLTGKNGNEAEVAFFHEGHKHLRWALSSLPATATWPHPPGIRGFPSRWNLEKLADTLRRPLWVVHLKFQLKGSPLLINKYSRFYCDGMGK